MPGNDLDTKNFDPVRSQPTPELPERLTSAVGRRLQDGEIARHERVDGLTTKVQQVITLEPDELLTFCGEQDRKLKQIQGKLKARIIPRGTELRISGAPDDVETAHRIIDSLLAAQRENGIALTDHQLMHIVGGDAAGAPVGELLAEFIQVPYGKGKVLPLTPAQRDYIRSMHDEDVIFCIGPAGTGKTYLAMAAAVEALMEGRVARIILVRPAVEAGERLGFLPGDIAQKYDPYVRPLYDALHEMIEPERLRELIEGGTIEIAPLAYMRGRTLNNCFIVLDEAQNTTIEQMKMFLTRMGHESKVVVTGDITQVDLPAGKPSGLAHAMELFRSVEGIEVVEFSGKDVVRHELVRKIVKAYEKQASKS